MEMRLDNSEDVRDAALGLTFVTGGMSYKDLFAGFISITSPDNSEFVFLSSREHEYETVH